MEILPEPTLRRLPWYLSYLEILKSQQEKTVSTTRMSIALGVDASQIAKDLSFLHIKGKTRIGYPVEDLANAVSEFLGFRIPHRAFIAGTGSLGAALIHDKGLVKYGLEIIAGFDTDPEKIGTSICGIPVFHISDMKACCCESGVEIGILAVPPNCAQNVADIMVASGLSAIWNFTPYRIRVRDGIVISNTSIYANLAIIYNRLAAINHIKE